MDELLESAAARAARYLREIQERAVAPAAEAIARLDVLREPFPDGPSEPGAGARAARRGRLAGDDGAWPGRASSASSSAARCPPRWPRTGWRRRGTRTRPSTRRRPPRPRSRRSRSTGCCDVFGLPDGLRRARSSPARRWPTSPRSPRRGTPCSRGGLGRRGRRPVRRAADHGRRRRGGAPDAAQGARPARLRAQPRSCACPSTARAACAPTRCRRSRRADDRVRAGGQREHRRVRPAARRSRERTRAAGAWVHVDGAFGLWAAAAPAARTWPTGVELRRLLGDRRAQVAERAVRQRPRVRARRRRPARGDGRDGRLPAGRDGRAQPVRLHARALAPRARRRRLGGAALARPLGPRRADRAQLPAGARASPRASRAAGYEILNDVVLNQVLVSFGEPDGDAARDRRRAGRRHVLVRRHGLAGPDGHAHQRVARGRPRTRTSSAASRRSCASLRPEEVPSSAAAARSTSASRAREADDLQAERQAVAVGAGRQRERRPAQRVERLRERIHARRLVRSVDRHGRAGRRGAEQDVVAGRRGRAAPLRRRELAAAAQVVDRGQRPRDASTSASVVGS